MFINANPKEDIYKGILIAFKVFRKFFLLTMAEIDLYKGSFYFSILFTDGFKEDTFVFITGFESEINLFKIIVQSQSIR